MTENENNCKCTGKVEKVIVRVPGPQGGKGETGPQGELNPADKEFIAQKAQEATEAATSAENAKDKAEESWGAAESAQNAALASQEAAKSSEDAAAESAAQAEESEGAAGNSATVAANAESGARTAASAAAVSAGEAEKAAGVAGQAKTDAVVAKDAAEVAQAGAETSAASAKDSADKAAAALKDTQAEKTDALAKIDATVTQAKSDIQAQVTVATAQATTATQAATTATQKATEADQSAKDAEASKVAAEEAKASAEVSAATATEQAGIATEKTEALTEAMGNLTTLSNDAVRFTAQEKTDAEKYQARKNIAASSAGEVEALKKQVANLQAQTEGKTFTYETDATEAYSKDVPDGAYPYAAVKNFGGKTIVWNQWCHRIEAPYVGGRYSVENGVATANPENQYDGLRFAADYLPSAVAGEKCYLAFTFKQPSESGTYAPTVFGKLATDAGSVNNWKRYSLLGTVSAGYGGRKHQIDLYDPRTSNYDNWQVKDIVFFNLTQMFGAGNEPTKEEFETMFPEGYYEYNTGELKSAPVNNLKIRGQNILPTDLEFTQGSSSSSSSISVTRHDDGSITLNGTASESFAMKGSLPEVEGNYQGKSLTLSSGNPLPTGVWLSWGNGAPMIVGDGSRTSNLAVGAVGNIGNRFYLYANSGATFNKLRIYPMMTVYREEKEYKPYSLKVRQIPQAVLDLEGYGWSAGTAKNWVDLEKKEYHREVTSCNIENLQIKASAFSEIFEFSGFAKKALPYTKNIISAVYSSSKTTALEALNDKTLVVNNDGELFYVKDSSITVENAKETLRGLVFYYELAEPEIIDISDILPDDNLIEVEEGGTITFENSNGDGFRIPVPSEIVYQKKVTTNE